MNYFKNKCGDPAIFFQNWIVQTKRKLLVKLKEILYSHSKITVFSNYIKFALENFLKLSIIAPVFM